MNKVILLTGFKPFGPYNFNPTMDIVNKLNGQFFTTEDGDLLKARRIVSAILPATYDAFEDLSILIDKHNPYAVVSLGFASSSKGFQFETHFHNKMGNFKYPDANGYNPELQIPILKERNENHIFKLELNLDEILYKVESQGINANVSLGAGSYICNSLGYNLAEKIAKQNLKTKQIFIHIPCTSEYREQIKFDPSDSDEKIFLDKKVIFEGLKIIFKNI